MSKEKKYSIKSPYLVHVLDISTGHISMNDSRLIQNYKDVDSCPLIVYEYPEGYFVYIPSDNLKEELIAFEDWGMSKEFCKIIKLASKRGCKYVQFDADGIVYEDLKQFNW
jgi:hypothetical protein